MHTNSLKKYYFIKRFIKHNIDKQSRNTIIIYRNYNKEIDVSEVRELNSYCKEKRLKFMISNNIKLSLKLNLDGAYIPAFNSKFTHLAYKFRPNFKLIGSAHNLKEIRIKEKQNVSEIFLSSIFKGNKNYLGINKFKIISDYSEKKIVALGGISKKNIHLLKLTKSIGFAGISFFE
jgi:thiamine-phosphate pyrophosphorylase|tara:strand:+ start:79 stop:606 length:528 start_codon:yes stop_codon:yes gene_type:complete